MKILNPFLTHGYAGSRYFCDRKEEAMEMLDALENQRNLTLYSRRKLGKTALVKHVFEMLPKKYTSVLIDLLPTEDFAGLVQMTASAITRTLDENSSRGQKIWKGIRSLRPTVTFDELSGQPIIGFQSLGKDQAKIALESLLKMLQDRNRPVIIAFDEFQQIEKYPQPTEAYLRTLIQNLPGFSFVFSGSDQRLLTEMFTRADRPFYQMSQMMNLDIIQSNLYFQFITQQFKKGKKQISGEAVSYILTWCRGITYFIQTVCNRLYGSGESKIGTDTVRQIILKILSENEGQYYSYRQMLTIKQWRVLRAVANEQKVFQPYGKDFMQKFGFTNSSSLKRAIESLKAEQLLYRGSNQENNWYEVQDVFFSRWMESLPL